MKDVLEEQMRRDILESLFDRIRFTEMGCCVQNIAPKEELLRNIECERNNINKLYDDAVYIIEKHF